jgi:hypothetical protein
MYFNVFCENFLSPEFVCEEWRARSWGQIEIERGLLLQSESRRRRMDECRSELDKGYGGTVSLLGKSHGQN